MELSPEQIFKNWEKHLKIIDIYITTRKKEVKEMVEAMSETLVTAPASTKEWYHNAFPGGYIDHVNRVVEFALIQKELWESHGLVSNCTEEEIVMAALFHDLGKIGDGELENYQPQTDKWRQEKLYEKYTNNPDLPFMLVQDRSLFILQKFGIKLTQNEYLGIKLHDGMYEDGNKPYLTSYNPQSKMKSNIADILHVADFMASKVEYSKWFEKTGGVKPVEPKVYIKTGGKQKTYKGATDILKSI